MVDGAIEEFLKTGSTDPNTFISVICYMDILITLYDDGEKFSKEDKIEINNLCLAKGMEIPFPGGKNICYEQIKEDLGKCKDEKDFRKYLLTLDNLILKQVATKLWYKGE